jgi:hypothetical protein
MVHQLPRRGLRPLSTGATERARSSELQPVGHSTWAATSVVSPDLSGQEAMLIRGSTTTRSSWWVQAHFTKFSLNDVRN